jgi:hypothetical protein
MSINKAQFKSLFTILDNGLDSVKMPSWIDQILRTKSSGSEERISLTIFAKTSDKEEESVYILNIYDWSDYDQSVKKIDELLTFLPKTTTIGVFRKLMGMRGW